MTKIKNAIAAEATTVTEQITSAAAQAAAAHAEITAPPSRESITEGIHAATDALAGVFIEMELRRRGDNGKLYPLNATMPGEVEDTGELEMVNQLRSLQTFLSGTICNRLEAMLDFNGQKLAAASAQLSARRRAEINGTATEHDVEVAKSWVENYEYQRTLLEIAFEAARDAYFDAIGAEYETRAMREEAKRRAARVQRIAASKTSNAHADRMARLAR